MAFYINPWGPLCNLFKVFVGPVTLDSDLYLIFTRCMVHINPLYKLIGYYKGSSTREIGTIETLKGKLMCIGASVSNSHGYHALFPGRVPWVVVPPKWAELTVGCDFCTLQNAPRFILLVILLTTLIFASQTLVGKIPHLPVKHVCDY